MARSRSSNVLMLLDCCYSGAIARGLRFRAGESVDVNDHLGGSGRAIITASNAMEYAFEGDELTGEGRPSVFTSAVVKALETGEADRDQDSWISVRELYDYVCDEVREVTPDQRPNMLSHLEGELFVARSRWVAPATLPPELTRRRSRTRFRPCARAPSTRSPSCSPAAIAGSPRPRAAGSRASRRTTTAAASSTAAAAALAGAAACRPLRRSPRPRRRSPRPPAAGARARRRRSPPPLRRRSRSPSAASAIGPEAVLGVVSRPRPRRRGSRGRSRSIALAGALLIVGWFLPWRWDNEPVPARDADSFDTDVRVAYAFLLVAGIAAIVGRGRGVQRPPVRGRRGSRSRSSGRPPSGSSSASSTSNADGFDAGFFLSAAGAAVTAPGRALARARHCRRGSPPRVTVGDVIGAVGGVADPRSAGLRSPTC